MVVVVRWWALVARQWLTSRAVRGLAVCFVVGVARVAGVVGALSTLSQHPRIRVVIRRP